MARIVRSSARSACGCSGEVSPLAATETPLTAALIRVPPLPIPCRLSTYHPAESSSPQLHTRMEKKAHQSLCCVGATLAIQNAQVGSVCGWSSGRYSGVSLLPSAAMATMGEPQVHAGTSSPEVTVTIWTVQHLGQAK